MSAGILGLIIGLLVGGPFWFGLGWGAKEAYGDGD